MQDVCPLCPLPFRPHAQAGPTALPEACHQCVNRMPVNRVPVNRIGGRSRLRLPSTPSLALSAVLILALALRLWGISFGLPYLYHPDEPGYVSIAQQIFRTGDLNPHFFNYPSLFFYINSLAYLPYYLVGRLLGIFDSRLDVLAPEVIAMGVGWTPLPTTFLLGRVLTALFGTATAGLVCLIASRLTKTAIVGLLAALMLAISPTNVANSHLITPDAYVVFFASLSFYGSLLVFRRGKTWHYVAAGVACGLTASVKYNGGLILLPAILAHLLRPDSRGLRDWKVYAMLSASGMAFLLGTPFALLDHQEFLDDLAFEARHYSTGHAGMEGDSLAWYLTYLWSVEGPLILFAALQVLRGLYLRSREVILVSAFPLIYFAVISSMAVRNDRTLMPMTPYLFILAASFLAQPPLLRHLAQARRGLLVVPAALVLVSLALPLAATLRNGSQLTAEDSRATARLWVAENLPAGSRVAIESYSPYLDPRRFSVQAFGKLIDQAPEWYAGNGFDYLIFSYGMFGRFYQQPDRYRDEVLRYDQFFRTLPLLRAFSDGGYEVRIYRVPGGGHAVEATDVE